MTQECRDSFSFRKLRKMWSFERKYSLKRRVDTGLERQSLTYWKYVEQSKTIIIFILINLLGSVVCEVTSDKNAINEIPHPVYHKTEVESNNVLSNLVNSDKVKPIYIPFSVLDAVKPHIVDDKTYHTSSDSGDILSSKNDTVKTGNDLWDGLISQCMDNPSLSCIQKNVYSYLDDSIGTKGDVNVTSGIFFKKNKVDYMKYTKEANWLYKSGKVERDEKDEDDILNDTTDEARGHGGDRIEEQWEPETPLEEVTDALYGRSVDFMMSHDLELKLPETLFHGATLKVSPRALTNTGALVHIDLQPKETEVEEGRIFFKKIKKYFKKKLMMAFLAIILVIKLIKLKLFFVLPLIIGVTAAKKLALKFVLFIFPALSHIFRLCSWYHQNYHTPKYHHHHHLISHHHPKHPHMMAHGPASAPGPAYGAPAPIYGPPSHASVYNSAPAHENYPQDWELSGPGLGSEYIGSGIHRNAIATFRPDLDDSNDINSWGLAPGSGVSSYTGPPGPAASSSVNVPAFANAGPQYSPNMQSYGFTKNPGVKIVESTGRPIGPPGYHGAHPFRGKRPPAGKDALQAEKEALLRAAQLAQRAPPSAVRDEVLRATQVQLHNHAQNAKNEHAQHVERERIRSEQKLVEQQQQILAAQDPETLAADRFYGSLVEKVENVLSPLGAREAGCRERAVCQLYHDPMKHSPYSNLVSNELSRDTSELHHPASSKLAVRYYRYVQAARDGQELKECLQVYNNCNIDFDKKN